jgi:3-oxoacyl-[acyl-carrier protein] reductase
MQDDALKGLRGRSALVTGAGDVGRAIALGLARQGAECVAVVDLDRVRAEAVATELSDHGVRSLAIVADITDPDAVRAMKEQIAQQRVEIDILVHNAGLPPGYFESGRGLKPFVDSDPADWAPLLSLNLEAVLLVSHALVGGMVERGHGRVITLVSDAARAGDRNMAIYAAAKGGASAFMRSLASEVGSRGVTANSISLGTVWRSEDAPGEQMMRSVKRDYPVGRLGSVEDIAAMVSFLASDAASWITGQVYGVNGGYTYGL